MFVASGVTTSIPEILYYPPVTHSPRNNWYIRFIGGVHNGVRALLFIYFIWFGFVARLAHWPTEGVIYLFKWFLPAFAAPRRRGGGSAPCGHTPVFQLTHTHNAFSVHYSSPRCLHSTSRPLPAFIKKQPSVRPFLWPSPRPSVLSPRYSSPIPFLGLDTREVPGSSK